jgi:iron-sulfur cluster assembly protein
MIKITKAAVEQIKKSSAQSQASGMPLRVAAKQNSDGTIEYGLGFDEKTPDDTSFVVDDVEVIVSDLSSDLLSGATLDFVEIEPGAHQFIFKNPNDPAHQQTAQ